MNLHEQLLNPKESKPFPWLDWAMWDSPLPWHLPSIVKVVGYDIDEARR